jgi:putative transposase
MPSGLKRFQHARQLHYITFTCYHRTQRLNAPAAKELFEQTLERIRRWYGSCVYGYVVVARKRNPQAGVEVFWQRRCYDFNVWSERKFKEKLRYIHCNPVRRGRVEKAEDWPWSSFRHYLAGVEGRVEIESQWTARKQERLGIFPQVKIRHED